MLQNKSNEVQTFLISCSVKKTLLSISSFPYFVSGVQLYDHNKEVIELWQ